MTIFRVVNKKNYTVINNYICTDNRLSWKAKGIWLYAFSRPDDWSFYLNDIINQSTDGRDSVRAGLKELEDTGYLKKVQRKNDKGQFEYGDWTFYETPQEIQIISPHTDFPTTDIQSTENHPLLSTDVLLSNEEEQQQEKQNAVVFFECLRDVDIPESVKVYLSKTYSERRIKHAIAYAFHPLTIIKKGLAEIITWACKEQPKFQKDGKENISQNKLAAHRLLASCKIPKETFFNVFNTYVEVGVNGQSIPFTLEYTKGGFVQLLQEALTKYHITFEQQYGVRHDARHD